MGNRETDISLIRKYLDGELDANAMHRLERRAQDDPFLMDALEGYEIAGTGQQKQVKELSVRLNQRLARRSSRRIIPLRTVGIAASVLLICSLGVWWLNNDQKKDQHPAIKAKLAAIIKPSEKQVAVDNSRVVSPDNPIAASLSKKTDVPIQAREIARSDKAGETLNSAPVVSADNIANANIKDSVPADTTPLNEAIVMEYSSQKKKSATKSVAAAPDTMNRVLQAKVAGVDVNISNVPQSANGTILQSKLPALSMKELRVKDRTGDLPKQIINGRVVAKDDGMPLPGVSVKVAGTNIGTQTDANGRFNLAVDSSRKTLVIAYIGYQPLKIKTNNRDSIKNITLSPNNASLNEVVVVGYGTKNNDGATVIAAHPQNGWSSFKKYLKEKAISPDGKTGVVKLSFKVDPNGIISDVQVAKGLSKATDQKAIDLLNDGPDWAGSTSGQPEKVTVRIKFGK